MAQVTPNTVFWVEDETGLYLQATTFYVWCPTGQTPIGRARTHFYGTLNLKTGQEIATRSDIMNAEASAQRLEMFLEVNPDVPTIFFPTASPDLNPQGQVWKTVRKSE